MPKLMIGGRDSRDYTDQELLEKLALIQGKRVQDVEVKARERKPRMAKDIKKYSSEPVTEL